MNLWVHLPPQIQLSLYMPVMYVSPHCDIHVIVVAGELCHYDTARKIGNNNVMSLSRLRIVSAQSYPLFHSPRFN